MLIFPGNVVGVADPDICGVRRLPCRDNRGQAAGCHDRCVRGAGHGAAHTHRRRQLCRLLPGAEEDRGSGAERRSQGAPNHANRKTLPSIVQLSKRQIALYPFFT